MKRLLCIVSSLDTGGAETFMMKIFRGLPSEYKLDFIVSTDSGFYEKEVLSLGGKIHRVPLRTEHPIGTFNAIRKIVKENKYQYVLKLCDTPIGFFDLLAAKTGGASKLCVRSCNANSNEGRIKSLVNKILRPFFNAITDVKIAPSKLAAEYTFGSNIVNKNKVVFLHNAVDLDIYQYKTEKRKNIREELHIKPEQLVVGHIGRFNYQKNHEFLLDIFASILSKRKDAILLLVGDGEKREEIVSKIDKLGLKQNVVLTGVRSDVPDLLSAMDVFVFPSFFEGMPNTIIEAQATGLPCVLSDTITKEAQITELLKYLSLNEKSDIWAETAINSVLKDRTDTREDFIKEGYNIEYSISKLIEIIF